MLLVLLNQMLHVCKHFGFDPLFLHTNINIVEMSGEKKNKEEKPQ